MTEKKRIESVDPLSEQRIIRRLLSEHFDGVVLIDAETGRLIRIGEHLSGKLAEYLRFDGTSFDETADRLIGRYVAEPNRLSLREALRLSVVKKALETRQFYHVNGYALDSSGKQSAYKHISFEYLDADRTVLIMIMEDITGFLESKIDPLTGLYNTSGFHHHVKKWIAANPNRRYRIQRYDLDRFKDINGVYGYEVGNRLLRDIGYRMKGFDTADSFSAHLSADHFVRFCAEDACTPEECYENFNACFGNYGLTIPVTLHMGVYDLCEEDCDSFTMSYKALLALQSVKGSLGERIAYYEKGMMDAEIEYRTLLNDIDRAIENEEFEVWFQPQTDFESNSIFGAEALVRWRHPTRGMIQPSFFVPLLEQSDCIGKVDRYVVERVCRYMRRWMDEMPEKPIVISVNLSRNDIHSPNLLSSLEDIVSRYRIPKQNLHLEITESAYIDSPDRINDAVVSLRENGYIVEMDDFGSGYSSLNTLKDIKIDVLKLDMKFLSGKESDGRGETILSAVIAMARALGLPVIAEGVETKEQAEKLYGYGCRHMQGFYFSKPIPACDYEALLKNSSVVPHTK